MSRPATTANREGRTLDGADAEPDSLFSGLFLKTLADLAQKPPRDCSPAVLQVPTWIVQRAGQLAEALEIEGGADGVARAIFADLFDAITEGYFLAVHHQIPAALPTAVPKGTIDRRLRALSAEWQQYR